MTTPSSTLRLARQLVLPRTYATVAEVLANQPHVEVKPLGWDEAKPFESIPGPKPLPIIGNAHQLLPKIGMMADMSDYYSFARRFYEKYGDICVIRKLLNKPPMVMLYDADEIEKVYRNEGAWPLRDAIHSMVYYRTVYRSDVFSTAGLIGEHGEEWQKLRTVVNPILMQPRVIKKYVNSVDEVAAELVDNMAYFAKQNEKGEMPEGFMEELYKFALESVALVAVDRKIGALRRDLETAPEVRIILDSISAAFKQMHKLEFSLPLWKLYSTTDWKKFTKAADALVAIFSSFIHDAEKNLREEGSGGELSAFQKMLKIDKEVAITMTMDMLQAGVDTTGKTLGVTLYLLAKHKKAQTKLREELKQLLPNKNSPVTAEMLNEAQYLKATIKEATRMAPIAVANVRTITKDIVLKGYQIPKGAMIQMMHMFISTDMDRYFARPKEFLPERFLRSTEGELSTKNAHPFAMMPFGFGPRSCIGKRLAQMESEVAVAKVVRNFYLDWPHPDPEFTMALVYGISSPLKLHVAPVES